MDILQYNLEEYFPLSELFLKTYGDSNFAIFDIETTGLNAKYEKVILIGLMYIENKKPIIKQFFCNHRKNEQTLLRAFADNIRQYELLISYNGNSFDIPFLNQRFQQNHIPISLNKYKNFDLLRFVRKYKQYLGLQDCALKSVEQKLGINRRDTISGKDSVELYRLYENNQAIALKNKILLHNYEDIYYLGHCLKIIDQVPHSAAIEALPPIFKPGTKQICYSINLAIKSRTLRLDGYYEGPYLKDYVFYDKGFSFQYQSDSRKYQISIPLYNGVLSTNEKCSYIDISDFPFSYAKRLASPEISENIILLQIDNKMITEEVHHFSSKLIQFIFKEIP